MAETGVAALETAAALDDDDEEGGGVCNDDDLDVLRVVGVVDLLANASLLALSSANRFDVLPAGEDKVAVADDGDRVVLRVILREEEALLLLPP